MKTGAVSILNNVSILFNRWFKGWLSKRIQIWKINDLTRIVLAISEYGINETKLKWNSLYACSAWEKRAQDT